MSVTTKGFGATRHYLLNIDTVGEFALKETLDTIRLIGERAMKDSLSESVGEKSRGDLGESIKSDVRNVSGKHWQIRVGPDESAQNPKGRAYGAWVAEGVGPATVNRNIEVMPGKWRFIGIRPPLPGHPFLEDSLDAMNEALSKEFQGNLKMVHEKVFNEAKMKEAST